MKKYLTLLLLLVSVCFYGQEEEREIVIEGFYKISLGGGGHALFPVVNNTVNGPINLEIERYKIPNGFVNTAWVRIKGKILRAKYNYDCYYIKCFTLNNIGKTPLLSLKDKRPLKHVN